MSDSTSAAGKKHDEVHINTPGVGSIKTTTRAEATTPTPTTTTTTKTPKHVINKYGYACDEHTLDIGALAARFETCVDSHAPEASHGLSSEQAASRLVTHGRNALSQPKEKSAIFRFLAKFLDKFMVMLLIAGVFCHVAFGLQPDEKSNLWLGIALYAVVVATCTVNFFHDRATAKLLDSIQRMLPAATVVIRDGDRRSVDPSELVPGDLVVLSVGNRVPADLRIVAANELKTECSSLTGESEPVTAHVHAQHEDPIEAKNVVFSSSLVMSGGGVGVVIRTGDETFLGSIVSLASGQGRKRRTTTMEKEVKRFVNFVAIFAAVTAVAFFTVGMARGGAGRSHLVSVSV